VNSTCIKMHGATIKKNIYKYIDFRRLPVNRLPFISVYSKDVLWGAMQGVYCVISSYITIGPNVRMFVFYLSRLLCFPINM